MNSPEKKFGATPAVSPNILEHLPLRGGRIAVAGILRTPCGMQRGARLMLNDLRRRGLTASAVDLSAPLGYKLEAPAAALLPGDLMEIPVSELIIHLNPPNFADALACFPQAVRQEARIIAYWAWELPVISDVWRECARLCAEIWAPSPFVANTLYRGLPDFRGEIRVVPHQVDLDPLPRLEPGQRRGLRADYGLAPAAFICGAAFSFNSNYARKNPVAAIDAFQRAFPLAESNVKLLIRAQHGRHHPKLFEHLVSYAGGDPRIAVFDPADRIWPMADFIHALDVFISLHRSEGYGLVIAEAAQAGVACLVTGWGLAPDIASRPEVRTVGSRLVTPLDPQGWYTQFEGAKWAEPNIEEAARWLRLLLGRHGAGH